MALSVKLDLAMAHTSWAGAPLPGLRARPLPEGEMTCGLPTQRRSHLSRAAGEVAVSAAGGGHDECEDFSDPVFTTDELLPLINMPLPHYLS